MIIGGRGGGEGKKSASSRQISDLRLILNSGLPFVAGRRSFFRIKNRYGHFSYFVSQSTHGGVDIGHKCNRTRKRCAIQSISAVNVVFRFFLSSRRFPARRSDRKDFAAQHPRRARAREARIRSRLTLNARWENAPLRCSYRPGKYLLFFFNFMLIFLRYCGGEKISWKISTYRSEVGGVEGGNRIDHTGPASVRPKWARYLPLCAARYAFAHENA